MPRVQNSSSFPFLESIFLVTLVTFLVTFDFSGPETLDFTDRYQPDIARSNGARPVPIFDRDMRHGGFERY